MAPSPKRHAPHASFSFSSSLLKPSSRRTVSSSSSSYLTPSGSVALVTPRGSPPPPPLDEDGDLNPSLWSAKEKGKGRGPSASYLTPPVSDDEDDEPDGLGGRGAHPGRHPLLPSSPSRRRRADDDWGWGEEKGYSAGTSSGRCCRLPRRVGGRARKRTWALGVVLLLLLLGLLATVSKEYGGGRGRRTWWSRRDRQVKWTHEERDTIIFTTILGSDLPPRHSPNQTLTNLAFLLRTEDLSLPFSHSLPFYLPPTLKIQRRFLLNRMVPGLDRDRVIALLEGAGKEWDEVAWDDEAWRGTGFRWDGLGEGGGRWGFGGNKTTGEGDEGADLGREGWKELDWAMADQNRFAMNNNGARNAAIRLAFESPSTRFAFPLDSNCAFTQAGLAALLDTISESEALERGGKDEGKAKDFVTVPMSRLLRNEDFAKWNEPVEFGEGEGARLKESRWERLRPDAPAEPQIGFRFTSTTFFSPLFRYGRRPKLSLLWSLGWVPFSREIHLKTHPWELPDRLITADSFSSLKHKTTEGGWTMRLFSGNPELEGEDAAGMGRRAGRRVEGIVMFLERLAIRFGKPGGKAGWGFGEAGDGESELGVKEWADLLLEKSTYKSYGSALLLHSEDSLTGYGFPSFAPFTPDAPPTHYSFPFDPISYSPLPLLSTLSTLPPSAQSSFLPLLRLHLDYLLHSPAAHALSASALSTHPLPTLATYDLHLGALALFLEDWSMVARVATRVGLRVEILLGEARREGGLQYLGGKGGEWEKAWGVWDALRIGLVESGWKGWGWWEGEWQVGGRAVGWDELREAVGRGEEGGGVSR